MEACLGRSRSAAGSIATVQHKAWFVCSEESSTSDSQGIYAKACCFAQIFYDPLKKTTCGSRVTFVVHHPISSIFNVNSITPSLGMVRLTRWNLEVIVHHAVLRSIIYPRINSPL